MKSRTELPNKKAEEYKLPEVTCSCSVRIAIFPFCEPHKLRSKRPKPSCILTMADAPKEPATGIIGKTKEIAKKIVDITVLDTHPQMIDHTIDAKPAFGAAVDATVFSDGQTNVDHAVDVHAGAKK